MSWTKHLRTARDLIRHAFDVANTNGDLMYAVYSWHHHEYFLEVIQGAIGRHNAYVNGFGAFGATIGQSGTLHRTISQIEVVAPTDATVLILGETGTGKELIARAIHQRSRRRDKPLVRVNCTSIPKELFENEFFGHVRGAFTGAIKDRAGRFEAATGGTLFLDEVGEIPLELQSKLLRVLQEKPYERVGEQRIRHADVRIIAATNRDNGTTLVARVKKMGFKRALESR